jgi:Putative Ig domain
MRRHYLSCICLMLLFSRWAIAVKPGAAAEVLPELPPGSVDEEYGPVQIKVAVSGTAPFTYALGADGRPEGLSVDPENGMLSGKPTAGAVGNHRVRVVVTDYNGKEIRKEFVLRVTVAAAPAAAAAAASVPAAPAVGAPARAAAPTSAKPAIVMADKPAITISRTNEVRPSPAVVAASTDPSTRLTVVSASIELTSKGCLRSPLPLFMSGSMPTSGRSRYWRKSSTRISLRRMICVFSSALNSISLSCSSGSA